MLNILVFYYSESGNTEKMAHLIAEGANTVDGIDIRMRKLDELTIDDFRWADGIAVGAPTWLGGMPWKVKKWFDEASMEMWQHVDGKIACAFSSAGAFGGGSEVACLSIIITLLNYGCLVFGLSDFIRPRYNGNYGAVVIGAPESEEEIESCKRLGRRLAEWVATHKGGRGDMHPLKAEYKRTFG